MRTREIDEVLGRAVAERVVPGASWALSGPAGEAAGVAGRIAFDPDSPPVSLRTRYDLASLTKPLVTAALAMRLVDQGRLCLHTELESFIPGFRHRGVTVESLLRHTSGLPATIELAERVETRREAWRALLDAPLEHDPGTRVVYSCPGYAILLRALQCVLAGPRPVPEDDESWDARRAVAPVVGENTFGAPLDDWATTPPTGAREPWRRRVEDARGIPRVNETHVQGSVHDPLAFLLGGVAGNAGLFGTAQGVLSAVRDQLWSGGVRPQTIAEFTTRPVGGRLLGWEAGGAPEPIGAESFGHTGFTGTLIWIDPALRVVAVLLTNFVHGEGRVADTPSGVASRADLSELRRRFLSSAWAVATRPR